MKTAYDWITLIIFAGLVTQFLRQSAKPDAGEDRLFHYLVPSVGCALANWLGNEGYHLAAVGTIAATLGYIAHFVRPWRGRRNDH